MIPAARSRTTPEYPPVTALNHRGLRSRRFGGAVPLLTTYIVLLFAIPSNAVISALGSLGRPSLIWGIVLLFVWVLTRLQRRAVEVSTISQPVKIALGALLTIALISLAAALFRGQPYDQVSPAITSIARLLSLVGVVLIAVDGLRTRDDMAAVIRRLVIAATALALFGLAQFFSGSTLLDWVESIPGITVSLGGVDTRGSITRAAATATHPLEFTATMAACLPIAVSAAVAGGYRAAGRWRHLWWAPPVLMLAVSVLAVSRSATIGLVVAVVASIPGLPRAYRWVVAGGTLVAVGAIIVVVPGLFGTVVALFAGAGEDPSTLSRTNALARAWDFIEASPLIGEGFGTFLSRYYIFDNQWVLMTIELGILGTAATLALVLTAAGSAWSVARRSHTQDTRTMAQGFIASVLTLSLLFAFFDGIAFPISAGMFFLVIGLTAAVRTIGASDLAQARADRHTAAVPRDGSAGGDGGHLRPRPAAGATLRGSVDRHAIDVHRGLRGE